MEAQTSPCPNADDTKSTKSTKDTKDTKDTKGYEKCPEPSAPGISIIRSCLGLLFRGLRHRSRMGDHRRGLREVELLEGGRLLVVATDAELQASGAPPELRAVVK